MKQFILLLLLILGGTVYSQQKLLIPMDVNSQTDHLRAYGIAYRHLLGGKELDWLLNYRGGSFLFDYSGELAGECTAKGVSYELLNGTQAAQVYAEVQDENNNMDVVRLEKVAKIAVYVPPNTLPWDDAVQLALDYVEIPYDKVWDEEVMQGKLKDYDWIHLHHEDFTGQYGRFYSGNHTAPWYRQNVMESEAMAKRMGFKKVSQLKLAVVKRINDLYQEGLLSLTEEEIPEVLGEYEDFGAEQQEKILIASLKKSIEMQKTIEESAK